MDVMSEIATDNAIMRYRNFEETPLHKRLLGHSLLELLGDLTGQTVLDLSCAGGNYPRLVKAKGAARVAGVDMSLELIQNARVEERDNPVGIDFVTNDQFKLFQNAYFNVVYMMLTLNYATNRTQLLDICKTAYRHLSPGGRMVAIVSHREPSRADNFQLHHDDFLIKCSEVTELSVKVEMTVYFSEEASNRIPVTDVLSLFNKTYIEQCLRVLGFNEIAWRPCWVVPYPGYSEEAWKEIVDSQFFTGLTCVKPM